MKAFGEGSISFRYGYDLGILLSHLEGLRDGEADNIESGRKKPQAQWNRLAEVEAAIESIGNAMAIGGEE